MHGGTGCSFFSSFIDEAGMLVLTTSCEGVRTAPKFAPMMTVIKDVWHMGRRFLFVVVI